MVFTFSPDSAQRKHHRAGKIEPVLSSTGLVVRQVDALGLLLSQLADSLAVGHVSHLAVTFFNELIQILRKKL